jgi:hypothetical protein
MSEAKSKKQFGAAGQALHDALTGTFDFSEDPHRVTLLEELCRTKDLAARLQAEVDAAPSLSVRGSQGQPVLMGQVDGLVRARSLIATLVKALTLPDTPELAEVKRTHLSLVRAAAARGGKRARYS